VHADIAAAIRHVLTPTDTDGDTRFAWCGLAIPYTGQHKMRPFATLLLGSVASVIAATSASAGPLTASGILQNFNAVIYTNASTSSDVEGAAVVGGNLSGATINNQPAGTPAGFGALTVYGSTTGNPINLDNGGNAYVGGTHGATINFNAGGGHNAGGYIAAPAYTIGNFETALNGLSNTLSLLAPTATLPVPNNNEIIKAIAGANGIAVFDLTAAQLAAIPSFSVNLNGASTVVFNVSGNAVFNANDQSGTSGADNIIWNFYNASSVALNTQIGGTVLAPNATVSNNNQIDGVLVANAWTGLGELHDYPFQGNLAVPEPASIAMLCLGLVGIGATRRRRHATLA
jgi:choice-of-anchor A domain-containing protein